MSWGVTRSRLAGFQCPCCGADLPYSLTRSLIFATIEERQNADDYCFGCSQDFRVQQPGKSAHLQAHRRFAVVSVGLILLGLAVFGLLDRVFPNLPGLVALGLGLGPAIALLPFVEAWATRPMTDFRQIKRRRAPLAPRDAN